jgi:predicted small secreted protein
MMKKNQLSLNYLFILVLLVASMALAACGTAADSASAAGNDAAIAVAAAIDEVEAVQNDTVQADAAAAAAAVVADPAVVNAAAAVDVLENVPADTYQDTAVSGNGANGNGYGQGGSGQGTPVTPSGDLTTAEIEALQYMREEEKLARDVYLTLFDKWGTPIFSNIANSEQAHMDAVLYLIESFGLEDPAADLGIGEFQNPDLQVLYDQLVKQGQDSPEAALLVGGAIEEIDILDLEENIGAAVNPSVIQVFENLLSGSINHLKGFARNYVNQTGNSYEAQYMSQSAVDELIDTASGQGNGPGGNFTGSEARGNGRGGRGGGQGGNSDGQGNSNGRGGRSG